MTRWHRGAGRQNRASGLFCILHSTFDIPGRGKAFIGDDAPRTVHPLSMISFRTSSWRAYTDQTPLRYLLKSIEKAYIFPLFPCT